MSARRRVELCDPRLAASTVAHTLRSLRLTRGLTQRAVANAIHTKQSSLCSWEIGGVEPRLSSLVRWTQTADACVVIEGPSVRGGRLKLHDASTAVRQVAAALRHVRVRRGWTQYDLADALYVRQGMVSGLECGRFDVRISTLVRWAEAVGAHVVIELPTSCVDPRVRRRAYATTD